MSVFEAIQSKCEKIRTRITPNTETFHVVKDKVIGGYEMRKLPASAQGMIS